MRIPGIDSCEYRKSQRLLTGPNSSTFRPPGKRDSFLNMDKETVKPIDSTKPQSAYEAWTNAMESRDIDRVIDLYERDESALWGTLANELKIGRDAIKTYFDSFLDRSSLAIETLNVAYRQPTDSIALANGAYAFSLGGPSLSDPIAKVEARFSFVFRKSIDSGEWKILDHHSSKFPG